MHNLASGRNQDQTAHWAIRTTRSSTSSTFLEIKCAVSAEARDWAQLKAGVAEGVIHQGFVVYLGDRSFAISDTITVIPAAQLLAT